MVRSRRAGSSSASASRPKGESKARFVPHCRQGLELRIRATAIGMMPSFMPTGSNFIARSHSTPAAVHPEPLLGMFSDPLLDYGGHELHRGSDLDPTLRVTRELQRAYE